MTPNETKLKTLKAADLRGIAALAADGKLAPEEASRIIRQYIIDDRVKASLEAIRELRPYFEDSALYDRIKELFRKKKGLPPFEFDRETAQNSIENQVLADTFGAVPAPDEERVVVADLLKEYNLRLEIRLVSPRRPRKPTASKPKKAAKGGAK